MHPRISNYYSKFTWFTSQKTRTIKLQFLKNISYFQVLFKHIVCYVDPPTLYKDKNHTHSNIFSQYTLSQITEYEYHVSTINFCSKTQFVELLHLIFVYAKMRNLSLSVNLPFGNPILLSPSCSVSLKEDEINLRSSERSLHYHSNIFCLNDYYGLGGTSEMKRSKKDVVSMHEAQDSAGNSKIRNL